MKFTKKEIDEFVEQLIFTNESMWTALCSSEELISNNIFKEMMHSDNEELMKTIAERFYKKASEKSDVIFAQPEMNSSLQDFQYLGDELSKYLK